MYFVLRMDVDCGMPFATAHKKISKCWINKPSKFIIEPKLQAFSRSPIRRLLLLLLLFPRSRPPSFHSRLALPPITKSLIAFHLSVWSISKVVATNVATFNDPGRRSRCEIWTVWVGKNHSLTCNRSESGEQLFSHIPVGVHYGRRLLCARASCAPLPIDENLLWKIIFNFPKLNLVLVAYPWLASVGLIFFQDIVYIVLIEFLV